MIFIGNFLLPHSNDRDDNPELALIRRCQKRDRSAFNELITPYLKEMHTLASMRLRNPIDVEDVIQNSSLQVWQDIKKLRHPESFYRWLRSIVIHQCQNWLRKQKERSRMKSFSELSPADLCQVQQKLQVYFSEEIDLAEILECIHRLPEKYKEALLLRYLGNCSWTEISKIMGITKKNAEIRIHRGKKQLIELLAQRRR